jgi:hypothetical protein
MELIKDPAEILSKFNDSTLCGSAQQGFDFSEHLLDRI